MKTKYLYYRTRQLLTHSFMALYSIPKPTLIKGTDSITKLPLLLEKEGFNNALLVTTPGFLKRGSLEKLFYLCKQSKIRLSIFSDVSPDPTIGSIEKGVLQYQEHKCQCVIAIGGGSVMDCAKIIAARIAKPNQSVPAMTGLLKIHAKIPALFAVPTTAGTGSECTAGAVITDEINHYKHPVCDFCLIPKYAILDPELTCSLPASITSVTGMDALTHAIEAYINCFGSKQVKIAASKCVKLVYENLLSAYQDGENRIARENMLLAAYYGGISINHNYVGYVHAIAHALGGLYGIPHGSANATILPIALNFYGHHVYRPLSELADVIGISGSSQEEKAQKFIASIRSLNQQLDIPQRIMQLREEDYDVITKRALLEANPTYPVPVILDKKELTRLLQMLG